MSFKQDHQESLTTHTEAHTRVHNPPHTVTLSPLHQFSEGPHCQLLHDTPSMFLFAARPVPAPFTEPAAASALLPGVIASPPLES
jgi:hypothetical protein